MLKRLTKNFLLIVLIVVSSNADAQQWLGRTTGNYSGTYGIYNNASSLADSKYKYYFNFWGRGVNFYNNYLTYNAPVKLNHWANNTLFINNYRDNNGKVQMGDDWLIENLNGKDKQFSFNQDIWGPAFMFPVSKHWNMSINTRQRSGLQMFGFSEDAAVMARNGSSNGQIASITKGFSANVQSFQELSFTLGGVMTKNDHHSLNGGVTLKLIRGLGAAYIKGNEINIQGTGANSALVNGDFQYAYTDDKAAIAPFNDPYGLFSLRSRGAGAGFDIGLTYTYSSNKSKSRPKWECNLNDKRSNYNFKLSMALNDIGGVRYNRRSTEYSFSSTANTNVTASSDILNGFGIANQNGFDSIGKNVFGPMGASKGSGFNTSLPASFNLQMDFKMSKNLYTSVYWNQSLKGNNTAGLRSTSMVSVIPRFESRAFEFSMPITLSENYKNFYLGAYTRIGPVFFGSDNLGGLLNVASSSEFTGADIYGGVSFGIGHCHSRWYRNNVDPVYMDSTDSLRTELHDTVERIKKDTLILKDTIKIIKKDTVYIDKTTRTKADLEKEAELKRREAELNARKARLDAREKVIIEKEKGTVVNESEELKTCKTTNGVLVTENTTLKNKVNTQAEVINQLKKQIEVLEKANPNCDLEKQKCAEEKIKTNAEIIKLQEDILKANKKISELQTEIEALKKAMAIKNTTEIPKGTEAEKLARANKQVDSLKLVIIYLEADVTNCKKNAAANEAEILKKAQVEKTKAQNDAKVLKKQNDSLSGILVQRTAELDNCKKSSTMNNAEVVKKAEADKTKAENNAKVLQKQKDSLSGILVQRTADLENCKKNSTMNNAEILKKAEADKTKAENDAKVAKKQADSLSGILVQRTTELENCKKNSTLNSAEIVKKAEADKAKAENEAKVAKKQADSLSGVLVQRTAELENCKKNSTENNADEVKLKKCTDENTMLKAEMKEMSGTIGRLNTKASILSNKVDSLVDELKNCCKNCATGSSNDAELLKKCEDGQTELKAEINRLNTVISKKDKSLDSLKAVHTDQTKKQVELNAQISKLNSEITELKTNNNASNCDDVQKQLEDKTAELNKLKTDNSSLQNQVKNLTSQLNEYKVEYSVVVKQSQLCTAKLDSCKRGLFKQPGAPAEGEGGGPHEGNSNGAPGAGEDKSATSEKNDTEVSAETKGGKGLEIGAKILGIMLEAATQSNTSKPKNNTGAGGNTETAPQKRPTESNAGKTGTAGNNSGKTNTNDSNTSNKAGTDQSGSSKRPTETGSGSSGSGSSGNNSDRAGSGSDASTRRR